MADTIESQLEHDATVGVQRTTVDGMSVELMPVKDRIEAANFVAQQQAAGRTHAGLRFTKLVPTRSQ